ncbi:GH36-type glycosyl hydrolase domain-containing protein [Undibacterium sp. SXout7W]|uniref:GH36-type glycosyl hydrolase domain-containing protein n=1 Tax=Undibacterium sp. SXout7W TaxID=3413049 RepID=UPI003BF32E7F
MKIVPQFLSNTFHALRATWFGKRLWIQSRHSRTIVESPLRAELFSALQMEQHGKILANSHQLSVAFHADQLLSRLSDNEDVIINTCSMLTDAIKSGFQVTPAAAWLLDNFYLIEDQIRTAKHHLPKNYSKELPRLLRGSTIGRPRVYDIALETISHGDGRVDPENLRRFISAYQLISTLKLGELWAIPIMLRLALIENLRRVATRLATTQENRKLAIVWADAMISTAEKDPSNLILLVADMSRSHPPLDSSFVAELVRRLQGQAPTLTLPLNWLSQRLAETGHTIEKLVHQESQKQAADQISISNSIGSLRLLTTMDWREFVESMSAVEQILLQDPSSVYPRMDFATRDRYRHVIEKIAKSSPLSECNVAKNAMQLASNAVTQNGKHHRRAHLGYFLIDKGLPQLEQSASTHLHLWERICRITSSKAFQVYIAAIFTLSVLTSSLLLYTSVAEHQNIYLTLLLSIAVFFVCTQFSLAMINWVVTLIVVPSPLPRMDFSKGIPPDCCSLIVVPTILFSNENINELTEAMEVRFLANRDDQLRFCILSDFADAAQEILPEDISLLERAKANVDALNQKYPRLVGAHFLLLHRPRIWNAQEKVWMSFERKRGKLSSLNSYLRGKGESAFSLTVGNTEGLGDIKYVITLDTDTELPRDAATLFIATMAHVLNRPNFDSQLCRVTEGYGILQPRVTVGIPSSNASRYELLYGGDTGIDPYTRSVSDVYQDIFSEGSFIGKGIYDVDIFEKALKSQMPENRILSHDLLEGCYARSGLLSDVPLIEQYPSSYLSDMQRRHRWIRGDWQIASWLLPRVPGMACESTGKSIHYSNPLSGLSRWKLFDNLRRSIVPPAFIVLLMIGWFGLSPERHAWFWSSSVLALLLLPSLFSFSINLFNKPKDLLFRQHIAILLLAAKFHLLQTILSISFLPFEAWVYCDAILRTQWRVWISHEHLLEWNPSNVEKKNTHNSFLWAVRKMWVAPFFAVITLIAMVKVEPVSIQASFLFLLSWFASPFVAYWISLPRVRQTKQLSTEQNQFLHLLARKTWHFFETYVGPKDNWLPPDNIQQRPTAVIAHRTSPTNIGLSLLANVIAYDFGYLCASQLIMRTDNTFKSLLIMDRHQGHFFNWYDTLTLTPLQPMYVSTVDSGNLSGHLLTLRPALLELIDSPIIHPRLFQGLRDTYYLLQDSMKGSVPADLLVIEYELDYLCHTAPTSLTAIYTSIKKVSYLLEQLEVGTITSTTGATPAVWLTALTNQCSQQIAEISYMIPWITSDHIASILIILPDAAQIPTLRQLSVLNSSPSWQFNDSLSVTQYDKNGDDILARTSLIQETIIRANSRIKEIEHLAKQAINFSDIQYDFLYDSTTHLLAIGYNINDRRCDPSRYDLLASEARLATFVGIAQGQLPQESWFALGRQLTIAGGEPILLSWSGSMFEYLMPLLIMPTYQHTLLQQTYHSAVMRQIQYGQQRSVPWGISESGYNAFDTNLNYQYRAFGVPGLGFKRGLGDDLVIAPYASMMALMIAPEQACENLQLLSASGFAGEFGFFEAIDYTPSRLPRGQHFELISSFMSHHQGMGLLSLGYLLLDRPLQKRFESDPLFKATIPLLHERVPQVTANYANTTELADIRSSTNDLITPLRILSQTNSRTPEVQLLSNGRYHVMVTSSGGSYSRWNDIAITRWNEDSTRDNWGSFCYVRDIETGRFWSTAFQPSQVSAAQYEVIFSEGRAEFRRSDNNIDLHTEIVVSPEDDIELRRTRILNRSRRRRTIEFTSYAEVVLALPAADNAHPAFSKLFVQTEILREQSAILCARRPRSINENVPTMFHLIALHGVQADQISYETDRLKFIGRCNTTAAPDAMLQAGPLSGSEGSVLDPIVAIRYQITLNPEQSATIDLVSGIADTRDMCLNLIEKYKDQHLAERVVELSWTHSQVVLRQLNISEKDAQLYARLANSVIYLNPLLRANQDILAQNYRGQSALWSYAISGDLPIVLLHISNQEHIELVRQLIQAHAYWQSRGLAVDLVIWNEDHANYRQILQDQILGLISSVTRSHALEKPGGIYVRSIDQISNEDRILFQSVARVILNDQRGTLLEQLNRRDLADVRVTNLVPVKNKYSYSSESQETPTSPEQSRLFSNGIGGFSEDGQEYLITVNAHHKTPAPWINVLANPNFGTIISESGQSYTWSENAHEFRLSPWHNDPVSDSSGEAYYIRDEETGKFWSPTPLPCCGKGDYQIRHGFGYSTFTHTEDGIYSDLSVFVAQDAAIKYTVIRLENHSDQARRLSVTGYIEWVLGDLRSKSAMHIVTALTIDNSGICARNPYNTDFPGRIAFFSVNNSACSVTADRSEFIGRNGSLRAPAAMSRSQLSGKLGAGFDPCAALQVPFDLNPGQHREIIFILGMADHKSGNIDQLIQHHRQPEVTQKSLDDVRQFWKKTLSVVQVETPDLSLNILTNGWLLYQTIACRLWARSGYYQSGGAFGFRDQLQDTMALSHTAHHLAREQIILCAAHQFTKGDVQHWWHPPTQRGVRTHCSDDYLWLPLAVARYITSTGDKSILDENIPFIEGRDVNPDEDSYYDLPIRSSHSANLYMHCTQAIDHSLRFGTHGLPLMGSCDWNDGMDKVGHLGKGESVWLGFFLYDVLTQFSTISEYQNDYLYSTHCKEQAKRIALYLDTEGWDGDWYRRAFFDDGTPLGSANNSECQIDSISQSWSILSGAGETTHANKAMNSLYQRLVKSDRGIIQLLDPPFDKSTQNPGYIRGYVPGVRENGGQYTHAAIWAGMAFAKMGSISRAWEVFDIINPINHGNSKEKITRYKVEPYVIAGDVYGVEPHIGRGGWTWYTGSAGWMYTFIIESLLGLKINNKQLSIAPCMPQTWGDFQIRYRYHDTDYLINVTAVSGVNTSVHIDNILSENLMIPLLDDHQTHHVNVVFGRKKESSEFT